MAGTTGMEYRLRTESDASLIERSDGSSREEISGDGLRKLRQRHPNARREVAGIFPAPSDSGVREFGRGRTFRPGDLRTRPSALPPGRFRRSREAFQGIE